jgi:hypothetical protein
MRIRVVKLDGICGWPHLARHLTQEDAFTFHCCQYQGQPSLCLTEIGKWKFKDYTSTLQIGPRSILFRRQPIFAQ